MLSIDIGGEVASAVLFLLILIFVVLFYIAYLIKNFDGKIGSSERIIEKHVLHGQSGDGDIPEKGETEEEKRARIQRDIELEEKWNRDNNVEAKINGVGTESTVNGKGSLDAVNKLRKMNEDDNKKS